MSGTYNNGTEATYEIRIEGDGLTLEREVSEAKVAKILGILLNSGVVDEAISESAVESGATEHQSDPEGKSATDTDGQPSKSIAEFMNTVGAGNNYERLAAIALYHREVLGRGTVHRDEFPTWFERAGRSAPSNLTRDLKNAVKENLIAESTEEDNRYYPTNDAEQKLSENNE
jgi:hypothetical protein